MRRTFSGRAAGPAAKLMTRSVVEAAHLMERGLVLVEGRVRWRRDLEMGLGLREGRWVWFPRRREFVDAHIVGE